MRALILVLLLGTSFADCRAWSSVFTENKHYRYKNVDACWNALRPEHIPRSSFPITTSSDLRYRTHVVDVTVTLLDQRGCKVYITECNELHELDAWFARLQRLGPVDIKALHLIRDQPWHRFMLSELEPTQETDSAIPVQNDTVLPDEPPNSTNRTCSNWLWC